MGAAILAGGRASRLGGIAKGLIPLVDGLTIIDRMIAEIRASGIDEIILSTNDAEIYGSYMLPIVPDLEPEKGPLGGLCGILGYFQDKTDAVLIMPCDMPNITSREIITLCRAFAGSQQAITYASTNDGVEHPLCAVVDVAAYDLICDAVRNGRLGVGRLWRELEGETVIFTNVDAFININTPEDVVNNQVINTSLENMQRRVQTSRITLPASSVVQQEDIVVREETVTLAIAGVGNIILMCSPSDLEALTLGFMYTEGYITKREDAIIIPSNPECLGSPVVQVSINHPVKSGKVRNLLVTSSCGACGVRSIQDLITNTKIDHSITVCAELITGVVEKMQNRQPVFRATGGTHAAAIFSEDGEILACAEDIGRHNALDKAIGMMILAEHSLSARGVVLSGRVSFEMAAKAARAGLEIITAVSAPTSLAVEAAQKCGITLCGFARRNRLTVYTHPERII